MQIEKSRINEIGTLHGEIVGHLKTSIEKAIRIGELLTEQKASLRHGEFTPWIEGNLPFTDRTARNYMRLHRKKDRLKTETVSDLKSAYKLLAAPDTSNYEDAISTSPTEWLDMIRYFNSIIGSEDYFISEDKDWWPNFCKKVFGDRDDDGMTINERQSFALWMNIKQHACYYAQRVWHRGRNGLPAGLLHYFILMGDNLGKYKNEKPRACFKNDECPIFTKSHNEEAA